MKYLYDPNNITHKKRDHNGNVLCQTRNGFQLVLNDVGDKVLSILNCHSDTEEIVDVLSELYPSIEVEVLRGDLTEIFELLDLFGVIVLKNTDCGESIDGEQTIEYNFSGDLNYKQISSFLVKSYNAKLGYFCGVIRDIHYFDAVQLRHRVMTNYEYGVFASKGNQIISYLSVIPPKDGSVVMSISSVFLKMD